MNVQQHRPIWHSDIGAINGSTASAGNMVKN
jgi:hypothetical protein